MNEIALPVSGIGRKWTLWVGLLAAVLLAASGIYWKFAGAGAAHSDVPSNMLYRIIPIDLPVKIPKDGELQAINNIEISSLVEGQTTIQTIVPEGSTVKKDDILVTLDSSAIKQKIEDTTLDVEKADADLTTSQELMEIQKSTNSADIEAAEVALTLARLDLKQYEEGTYLQQLANARTDLEMAQTNLKNQEDKLAQTRSLFTKGFVTSTAIKDDQLSVTTAENTVSKAETSLKVLVEYAHQMDKASKDNAVSQAEQRLARTKRINASNLAQRVADLHAKEQALAVLKRRKEHYEEQFAACTIKAPADGLVIYATSGERERYSSQSAIQEGATVRERQMLLRLPDTSAMKAVVRINESQVPRLREGLRARVKVVGVPSYIGATLSKISVLADSGQRQFNPDIKEYPVDLVLDETPIGLKPGLGAMTEILIDQANSVLAAPLGTIYSTGPDSYVFVRDGDQFVPRKVRIGRTNEVNAELLGDTINAGDEVLLLQIGQGPQLLEKAGIKVAPTTQRSDDIGGRRGGRGGRRGGGGNRGAEPEADGSTPRSSVAPAGGARRS